MKDDTKKPEVKKPWLMPRPGAIVVWRNAPGADHCFAVVTAVGRQALNCMLFPPDSKFGIPKDSVRHVDDPWNRINGVSADSGCWDFTDETKELANLQGLVAGLVADKLAAPKTTK